MINYTPTGIIEITGEHDAGKTLAALFVNYEFGPTLKEIAFFHDDVKEPGYPPDDFGLYVDVKLETKGMRLFQYRKFLLDKINSIKASQFKVIIFDTWTKFGESLKNYVQSHPDEFRAKDEYIMKHNPLVIGSQRWKDSYDHESQIVSYLNTLAPCVVVTSHLKDHSEGGSKTGKQIDELGKTWERVCNMRLWLLSSGMGVPTVLVPKRIHKPGKTPEGKPTAINVLPRRFSPLETDTSIWDGINRYWHEPVGSRELREDEKPNEFELSILDGILTKDQKEIWKANILAQKRQEEFESSLADTEYQMVKERVLEIKDRPLNEIMTEVSASFNGNYTLPQILAIIKEG